MSRPLLLDLYCGVGGAARGYQLAGFDVVGVDIDPPVTYCGDELIVGDALTVLAGLVESGEIGEYDAVHASPPCQRWSVLTRAFGDPSSHPDLLSPTREALRQLDLPWVIENVPGAPLVDPVRLCGSMFDLRLDDPPGYLRRHRYFESNVALTAPRSCRHEGRTLGVYGHGHGTWDMGGYLLDPDRSREIMQMPWAGRDELAQAIPPAYTHWIGGQLLAAPTAKEHHP